MDYDSLDIDQLLSLNTETLVFDYSSFEGSPSSDFDVSSGFDFAANGSTYWKQSAPHSPAGTFALPTGMSPTSHPTDPKSRKSSQSSTKSAPSNSQLKRKEQNRAAQQAYRKRKEELIQNLQKRIDQLESSTFSLQVDNDRLQDALQRLRAQNEYLQASSPGASHASLSR